MRDAKVERASGPPATPLPTPVNPEKPPPQTVEVPRTPAEPPAWSTFHGNLQRNGFADVIGPQQQPHVVWKAELGGQLRGSPVIGRDGVAYVGSTDKNLYAVKNGAVLWSFPAEAPINETPAIVNGEILFRTIDRTLFHLTESGQLQSKTAQDGAAEYFAASHGVSYAASGSVIRSNTGLVFQLGNPAATFPVIGRTGQVCAGDTAGNLTCFDASGERKCSYQADGRITSTPAITPEGDLIFGCADRNVYCVRDGQLRWKFLTGGPVYSAPVYDRSGVIFVGSNDGHVYAIGAQGQERWRIDLGNEVRSSPAFDRNGGIYVSSINRRLFYLK
jgi:outer membrane protein assembly factor BamB